MRLLVLSLFLITAAVLGETEATYAQSPEIISMVCDL
jgi:hypothetical protein